MASMNNPIDGRQDRAEERSSPSFMHLFGQMVMLPFTVFVHGMALFVKTMQGMQGAADKGMNVMAGEATQTAGTAPSSQSDLASSTTSSVTDGTTRDGAETIHEEERNMPDRNLSDDMLKLVRYKILFVKRDYEVAFPEKEELVPDNMTDTAYTAWKVAEFIQHLDQTNVPGQWGGGRDQKTKPKYPNHPDDPVYPVYKDGRWVIMRLDEDDKKYLRVYYEVLDRYVREDLQYEQEQLDALKDIAKAVREKPAYKEAAK
jgi:hypothetical protein